MTRRLASRPAAEATSGGAGAGEGETFAFSGPDALARFLVGILVLGAGMLPLPLLLYPLAGWPGVTAAAVVAVLVVVGLRAEIAVSPREVVITRRWFLVPYRRYRAPRVDDVWYGGDWGEPEGALGVVVRLGKREIHLGSPRTMHALYRALARPRSRPALEARGDDDGGAA